MIYVISILNKVNGTNNIGSSRLNINIHQSIIGYILRISKPIRKLNYNLFNTTP